MSYTALIRDPGHEPRKTVFAKQVRSPTQPERELLELTEGADVLEGERCVSPTGGR